MLRCKLAVVATTRSGTVYATQLLRHLSLDVLHEALGADGGVGFNLGFTDRRVLHGNDTNPGRWAMEGVAFDRVWHQVRHPLATLGSLQTHNSGLWAMVADGLDWSVVDVDPIKRAARYWYEYTQRVKPLVGWRYRVEDLHYGSEVYYEMCERLGVVPPGVPPQPLERNARPHTDVTWEILRARCPRLAARVKALAQELGYEA